MGVVSPVMGRTEAPALQDLCAVLVETSGMVMLDCDIDKGASGAPVFATIGGQPRIVSVIAALARQGGRKVALGSALAPEWRMRAASRETALTNGRIMRSGGQNSCVPDHCRPPLEQRFQPPHVKGVGRHFWVRQTMVPVQ